MIDYHTFQRIKQLQHDEKLSVAQIARELNLDYETVAKWAEKERYEQPKRPKRTSKLDPYKSDIRNLLNRHDYYAVQIFDRIKEEGYEGGYSILCDYIQSVRPAKKKVFLSLNFAPAECAQVDFGACGTVPIGNTQRRLSVFVMVFCYSRMIYLEFTLKQRLEHFLSGHVNAFRFFGGVPQTIMVDNCKTAILKHPKHAEVVPHPRYADLAAHYGFQIKACTPRKPNQKGRVERSISYIKSSLLNGLELSSFTGLNAHADAWRDHVANTRIHSVTKAKPIDLFQKEKKSLKVLPIHPYDCAVIETLNANSQAFVSFDSNQYSVPGEYAPRKGMIARIYPDSLYIYYKDKLIAQHVRSYQRNEPIKNPDHEQQLLKQRRNARERRLLQAFLALTHKAEEYYLGITEKSLNPTHHLKKIMAIAEIYGEEKTARAIEDACEAHAFSSEYIAHILEQQQRILPQKSPLHLTRKNDLLELHIPPPDLSIYNPKTSSPREDKDENE